MLEFKKIFSKKSIIFIVIIIICVVFFLFHKVIISKTTLVINQIIAPEKLTNSEIETKTNNLEKKDSTIIDTTILKSEKYQILRDNSVLLIERKEDTGKRDPFKKEVK